MHEYIMKIRYVKKIFSKIDLLINADCKLVNVSFVEYDRILTIRY